MAVYIGFTIFKYIDMCARICLRVGVAHHLHSTVYVVVQALTNPPEPKPISNLKQLAFPPVFHFPNRCTQLHMLGTGACVGVISGVQVEDTNK